MGVAPKRRFVSVEPNRARQPATRSRSERFTKFAVSGRCFFVFQRACVTFDVWCIRSPSWLSPCTNRKCSRVLSFLLFEVCHLFDLVRATSAELRRSVDFIDTRNGRSGSRGIARKVSDKVYSLSILWRLWARAIRMWQREETLSSEFAVTNIPEKPPRPLACLPAGCNGFRPPRHLTASRLLPRPDLSRANSRYSYFSLLFFTPAQRFRMDRNATVIRASRNLIQLPAKIIALPRTSNKQKWRTSRW